LSNLINVLTYYQKLKNISGEEIFWYTTKSLNVSGRHIFWYTTKTNQIGTEGETMIRGDFIAFVIAGLACGFVETSLGGGLRDD